MHAHVQIEYKNERGLIETLQGIDPRKKEDKEFVHALLDEYLEVLGNFFTTLEKEGKTEGKQCDSEDAGFHVYPHIH